MNDFSVTSTRLLSPTLASAVPAQAGGLYAEYFQLSKPIKDLGQVDFTKAPKATGTAKALDYMNSSDAFWKGGASDLFAVDRKSVV